MFCYKVSRVIHYYFIVYMYLAVQILFDHYSHELSYFLEESTLDHYRCTESRCIFHYIFYRIIPFQSIHTTSCILRYDWKYKIYRKISLFKNRTLWRRSPESHAALLLADTITGENNRQFLLKWMTRLHIKRALRHAHISYSWIT